MGTVQTLRSKGNGSSIKEHDSIARMAAQVYKEEDQHIMMKAEKLSEIEDRAKIEILLFDLAFGPLF